MVGLDKIALSSVIFFIFVIAGVGLVVDIETNYASEGVDMEIETYINDTYKLATNEEFGTATNQLSVNNNSFSFANDVQNKLLTGSSIDEDDSESSMFAGVFSSIKKVTTPISHINKIINQVAIELSIPSIYVQLGFVGLALVVLFSIIFLILRVKA